MAAPALWWCCCAAEAPQGRAESGAADFRPDPVSRPLARAPFCAIDFGTSNSAIALPDAGGMSLLPLEGDEPTMPTAVFYFAQGPHDADGPPRAFGRAALQTYVDGHDGRLMRSMKSLLGSDLIGRQTEIGAGRQLAYADVLAGYLKRLRRQAEARLGGPLERAVLGRPVYFVDDDPDRDRLAESQLADAARAAGFAELAFQFEPIAAAFDHEQRAEREQLLLVADLGGGTCDFSLVRIGPARRTRAERRDDVLAHHGIHVAGTDFDRRIALDGPLRALGHGALGPQRSLSQQGPPREVPSGIYHDLARWHLINGCYTPAVLAEMRSRKVDYADPRLHQRLMTLLQHHLGHELLNQAEAGKIALSNGAESHDFDLGLMESGLHWPYGREALREALFADLARIAAAAHETVRRAGVAPERVDALYFTGGSSRLGALVDAIAASFPGAERVRGDALASVARGLGIHALQVFA
jgi:hypothetical chaperone protein